MTFTYNVTGSIGQLRLVLGDTAQGSAKFSDEELQAFLDMEYGSLRLAAADAYTALAGKLPFATLASGISAESVKMGDFEASAGTADKATALLKLADSLRELEYNTPAFAVAEENLSGFNEATILRNWILRTQLP